MAPQLRGINNLLHLATVPRLLQLEATVATARLLRIKATALLISSISKHTAINSRVVCTPKFRGRFYTESSESFAVNII